MNRIFAFDVDGTLTEPRRPITDEFNEFFHHFAASNIVYLVSGSDRTKIAEQIPRATLLECQGLFTCSAAEFWTGDRLIYRKSHDFPSKLLSVLQHYVDNSSYAFRHGNHIEKRPGMLNVSVVGRNADGTQRKHYNQWDRLHNERQRFIAELNADFTGYEATAGGEISIDIVPQGWNKAIAKREIEQQHQECSIYFFGDRVAPGGNDKPLADALEKDPKHRVFAVDSYHETWMELMKIGRMQAA